MLSVFSEISTNRLCLFRFACSFELRLFLEIIFLKFKTVLEEFRFIQLEKLDNFWINAFSEKTLSSSVSFIFDSSIKRFCNINKSPSNHPQKR